MSCLDAAFVSQQFAPHSHDALVIAVTEAGWSSYTSRGRSAEATPSVLLVFNPAGPHAGHMRRSCYWRYRALYLARPALDALLPALGMIRLPAFTSNAVADAGLIRAFQLIRDFNRLTGMPPHAHVLRSRLNEAIRQMRHGASLSEAAASSGFYDQSALTRHFRARTASRQANTHGPAACPDSAGPPLPAMFAKTRRPNSPDPDAGWAHDGIAD